MSTARRARSSAVKWRNGAVAYGRPSLRLREIDFGN
jgi:hypothetical protein